MEKLIDALLNDENGISEQAYNALVNHLENIIAGEDRYTVADMREARELLPRVMNADATDGRFYFK